MHDSHLARSLMRVDVATARSSRVAGVTSVVVGQALAVLKSNAGTALLDTFPSTNQQTTPRYDSNSGTWRPALTESSNLTIVQNTHDTSTQRTRLQHPSLTHAPHLHHSQHTPTQTTHTSTSCLHPNPDANPPSQSASRTPKPARQQTT